MDVTKKMNGNNVDDMTDRNNIINKVDDIVGKKRNARDY